MLTMLYIIYNRLLYICIHNMEDYDYLKRFAKRVRTLREAQLKGNEIGDNALYTIISRWKAEGWVEKNGKSWIKKKA